MTGRLVISLQQGRRVRVEHHDGVHEILWRKAISEWGSAGDPSHFIVVPKEVFLSNLEWLVDYCRRFQTAIECDDETRHLIRRARQERVALNEALRHVAPLSDDAVRERLQNSRFKRDLRQFQLRDLGKLLALSNGANFSVPGAGKTTVTYALYEAERIAGRVERLLVIAPLSAFDAWIDEAKECFSPFPRIHRFDGKAIPADAEICLVHYQRLASAHARVSGWAQQANCHMVLDEAHRMKRGWPGQWGRSSLQLSYIAVRRDVLTGTPAPQSLRDLEAILDFTWPAQARRILPASVFQRRPPTGTEARTANAIRPLFVRTTKADLNLPKPRFKVVEIPLEGLQRDIYQALRNRYAGSLTLSRNERGALARIGQVAMYLLEAASNPGLLPFGRRPDPITARPRFPLSAIPDNSSLSDLIASYPDYENPPKFIALGQILRENVELTRKTLVWSNFVSNTALMEETFRALQPAVIHGGIPSNLSAPNAPRTREAELARFRHDPDCKLLIANPAAMSEGVSLHKECHDAVYVDRTFNAGQYLQSLDRIHRLGIDPEEETRITFLVTSGTVDMTVNMRVDQKAQRLGQILSDDTIATMALPDQEDYEEVLAEDDVAALLAHLRGEDAPCSVAAE